MPKAHKTVQIVLNVPLDAFEQGGPLKATGDIVSGHWVNLNGPIKTEVHGLPEGTDLRVGFNSFKKSLSIRHVIESKEPAPKTAAKDKPEATKLFG